MVGFDQNGLESYLQYMPGKDNTVADAMSRYAYPASYSREDVSFHGSTKAETEVKKLIEKEIAEGNMLGMIRLGRTNTVGSLDKGYHRVGSGAAPRPGGGTRFQVRDAGGGLSIGTSFSCGAEDSSPAPDLVISGIW
jgi:hypothetical protein